MQLDNLDLVVLKTLLTSKKYAIEFVNDCNVSIFDPNVLRFAQTITNYTRTFKEPPTLRVLTDKLTKTNPTLLEHIKPIWEQIEKTTANENEYKYNLQCLKDRFAQKQLETLQSSLTTTKDISKHLLDIQKTVSNIKQLSHYKTFESKTLKEAVPAFVDRFQAKKNNPELEVGISTGYSFFDVATNGLKPADLVLISGESGHGKSLLLANMAIQIWLQNNDPIKGAPFSPGKNIVYFSLEMPYEECMTRLVSRLSMVPSKRIENATLNKEEITRVKAALEFIKNYPNHFKIVDIADATAADIEMIIEDLEFRPDVVILDYLGLMSPNEKSEESDWLKQGLVAYEVRAIGRKHNLPIVSAVQLNRKQSGKDVESIGLSRLARSATIATHSTVVIQIEARQGEANHPDVSVWIIKNRRGPKTHGSLLKNLPCACLTDIPLAENDMDVYFPNVDDISEEMEELEL
jgi:replicative DNA helicase